MLNPRPVGPLFRTTFLGSLWKNKDTLISYRLLLKLVKQRPHCAREIWRRNFLSTLGSNVHTNPERNHRNLKTVLWLFISSITMSSPWLGFSQTQIQNDWQLLGLSSHLVKPSSSGTAGACGFLGKLFVCSISVNSSCTGGEGSVGFSSLGGDGGGGGPVMK